MKHLLAIVLLCVALTGCDDPKPDTLITSGYDEKEMDAAIARAQSEVDTFITELEKPVPVHGFALLLVVVYKCIDGQGRQGKVVQSGRG